jgi:hypothetical protein
MNKAKNQYQLVALQQKGRAYKEVAANRYRGQFPDEASTRQFVDEARNKNSMIEAILEKISVENPDLDVIFREVIGW